MRLLDFAEHLAEAFDIKALGDDYLKQAAAVDPNAEYKPRMLVTPEAAKAELARRAGTPTAAPATVPGTLKAGDGSTVVSGDGTPVQAGTQAAPAPTPAPAPAAAPEPAVVGGPIATPQVTATPLPAAAPATPAKKQWAPGVLGMGSTGKEVTDLQTRLGVPATGTFDQKTKDAVVALQTKLGIKADGAYGPQTKAADVKATPAPAPAATDKRPVDATGKPIKNDQMVVPATADKKEPYWVNGTRYEYKMKGGGRGTAPTGNWEVTAEPGEKLQWNSTRNRSSSNYTGPDSQYGKTPEPATTAESIGFANDELNRIVSLVHHR